MDDYSFLPNNSAHFSLFTSSPFSPTLHSPQWLMVLATDSKPAVHLTSNVLYLSTLSWLSDLAAALTQRQVWFPKRHAGHTFYISYWLGNAKSTSLKDWSLTFWNNSAYILLFHFYILDVSTPIPTQSIYCIHISTHCFGLGTPMVDIKKRLYWTHTSRKRIKAGAWPNNKCVLARK